MLRAALIPPALLALAACSAPSSTPPDPSPAPPPPPSATPLAAPAPSAPPPLPTAAPALSPRGAHALTLDRLHRESLALEVRRDPRPEHVTVEDTFVLISGERSAPFDAAVATTRQTVAALWHGPSLPFSHRPEESVVVWITSSPRTMSALLAQNAPYLRDTGLGMYDSLSRQIFFASGPGGMGTLNHELIHPLALADMPHAPVWLLEGLAALFEVPVFSGPPDAPDVHFGAHFRLQMLRDALGSPVKSADVKLDTLFTLTTDADFRANEALHYSLAREFLRWADARHQLWPLYHRWRHDILTDPTGEASFAAIFGKTPAEATAEWLDWIRSPEADGPAH